jgi:uncharacterized membrane protein YbaN (DUF454 family)
MQKLMVYRPDVDEPELGTLEALDLARRDEELNRWFTEQQRLRRTIRAELRSIQPPPGLKEAILAQAKAPPIPWWRHQIAWAAAAAVVLLLAMAAFWMRPKAEALDFAAFQSRMVSFALREYRMDIVTNDPQEIRRFLEEQGRPADYTLPAGLEAARPLGGARLSWQGHPVSMICFDLNQRDMLYLFVLPESAIQEGTPPPERPQIVPSKGLMTASWISEGRVYLLAGPLSPGELRTFL